jgi:translation initiation factor 2 subunit 1
MVSRREFPEEGELVVGTVQKVKGFGGFVHLEEYEGKEGFVHIAEVSTGWIKYIRDFIREGQRIVCKVIKVEPSKGHIDLSLKQVNEHQRREKIQQWKNEQKAEKLFEIVCGKAGMEVQDAYRDFGYDLIDTFGTLYGAFESCTLDDGVLEEEGFKGPWTSSFVEVSKENISPPLVDITGQLELVCPSADGINRIKEALKTALGVSIEGEVDIAYVGAPNYRVTVRAPDYKTAEESMKTAVDAAIGSIEGCGGTGSFTRTDKD